MAKDRARKKEKHRLKRKRRQEELRKAANRSPFDRLAEGEAPTCFINASWQEQGLASIYALKDLKLGGCVLGVFLVDLYCCGLKDCWGRLDFSRQTFNEQMLPQIRQSGPQREIDAESARRLVAGAIRFTRQNQFRLPAHYERWISVLGVSADQPHADLTGFGYEGDPKKLLYVGEMEDLEKRLIGETLSGVVKRTGLHFVCSPNLDEVQTLREFDDELDAEEALENEDDDEQIDATSDSESPAETVEHALELIKERLFDAAMKWCSATGIAPHARLAEALDLLQLGLAQGLVVVDHGEKLEVSSDALRLFGRALELQGSELQPELKAAMDQLQRFVSSFERSEDFLAMLEIELA